MIVNLASNTQTVVLIVSERYLKTLESELTLDSPTNHLVVVAISQR